MSRRRRALGALVALILIALVVLWFVRGAHPRSAVAAPPLAIAPASAPPTTGAAATPLMRSVSTAEQPSLARLKQEYENYRLASIYPHWSMPLTPDMEFALKWNATVTEDLAFDENGGFVRFDGSAGRVFANEPYVAWLTAWRVVKGEKKPLPIRVKRAAVSVTSGSNVGEAFEVAFHDDGKDGDSEAHDNTLSTRFVPAEHSELSVASTARIDAYIDIDGHPRHLVRDFVFAPRNVLEVKGMHDQLRDGSLVVTLDCEVLENGVYTFYANLVASDDSPIAMTKLSFPLTAGRKNVDLTFFGKVIRDRGIDGPYIVRDIHGMRRAEGDEMDVWWSHPTPHRTARYAADDLSDAEWNDPERIERLQNFERVIHEMENAQAGR